MKREKKYMKEEKRKVKEIKLKQIWVTEFRGESYYAALSEDGMMYYAKYDKENSLVWTRLNNPTYNIK